MKGKAARVSCCETRFLPASPLLALHLTVAGKVTLGAGHEGSQSVGQSMPHPAAGPAWGASEGWPWFLGGILLGFAQRWQTSPAGARGIWQGWSREKGWTGRVEGAHRLVPFPILYLIIGGDCPQKLTTRLTMGM